MYPNYCKIKFTFGSFEEILADKLKIFITRQITPPKINIEKSIPTVFETNLAHNKSITH